jgi:hypothetical protein
VEHVRLARNKQANKPLNVSHLASHLSTTIRRKSTYGDPSQRLQNINHMRIEFAHSSVVTMDRRRSAP